MYITTFYSFKGGVGRTMALVNVAVELARKGRRVLAVDFDLEAPGLDTFDLPGSRNTTAGMIDFVSTYLSTGIAPRIDDFVFESPDIGDEGGGLWIMPSGAHLDSYATTFTQVDWGTLYEQHDGFLLFEDLKEQWKTFIQPDYVLVDSRTGHTDVGGICTRQLPDAVVILFFPNAQNLRGLKRVVRDIRGESKEPRNKAIDLHFVMSNVPDLDDEDEILKKSIASFKEDLAFQHDPMMIHRYDSLSLLNQVIFTKDRPRSRLSKEYRIVTSEIIKLNPEDRFGALDYIDSVIDVRERMGLIRHASGSGRPSPPRIKEHLKKIEENHSRDGEVLFRLGILYTDFYGRFEDAISLFNRAIDAGHREPEVYLQRAYVRREQEDRDGASADAIHVLQSEKASTIQTRRALTLITADELKRFAASPAALSLPPDEQLSIASRLARVKEALEIAADLLESIVSGDQLREEEREQAKHELVLVSIGLGSFAEALGTIRSEEPDVKRMKIRHAFNYGMALWGERGAVVQEPFARVVEIERSQPQSHPGANYLQCMAVAHWAIGQQEAATMYAERAQQVMRSTGGKEFSCWRYENVSASAFLDDVDDILRLIEGADDVVPLFIDVAKPELRTDETPA